ncbi:hypothetical protein TWF718_001919 [Orbilia javanica]|uniref:C2H2-type domain-containing protein n=1 Tax=Orbilia javanica TaxID=47235 RepID=A0AAN8N5X8_9PEZI
MQSPSSTALRFVPPTSASTLNSENSNYSYLEDIYFANLGFESYLFDNNNFELFDNSHTSDLTSSDDRSNGTHSQIEGSFPDVQSPDAGAKDALTTLATDVLVGNTDYDENPALIPEQSQQGFPKSIGGEASFEVQHGAGTSHMVPSIGAAFQMLSSTVTGNQVQGATVSSTIVLQSPQPTRHPNPPFSHSSSSPAPEKRNSKTKQVYTCQFDGFKTESNRLYGEHMLESHNIKCFQCENCKFRTARSDNLGVHKKTCKRNQKKATNLSGVTKRRRGEKRVSMKNLPHPMAEALASTATTSGISAFPSISHSSGTTSATSSAENDQGSTSLSQSQTPSQSSECRLSSPANASRISLEHERVIGPSNSSSLNIDELMAKIVTLEQRNMVLERENSVLRQKNCALKAENQTQEAARQNFDELQEKLNQAVFDRDVWYEKCAEMRKVGRKQPGREP